MRAKPCSGVVHHAMLPRSSPKMKRGAMFISTPRHEAREGRRSVKRTAHLIFVGAPVQTGPVSVALAACGGNGDGGEPAAMHANGPRFRSIQTAGALDAHTYAGTRTGWKGIQNRVVAVATPINISGRLGKTGAPVLPSHLGRVTAR